jgi:hypothetical protein
MTTKHSFRGLLHRATHRIPGVRAHAERPAGHQGTAVQGRARRRGAAPRPSPNHHRWNHSPGRPPRFMPAWQRRIAAFFGREL